MYGDMGIAFKGHPYTMFSVVVQPALNLKRVFTMRFIHLPALLMLALPLSLRADTIVMKTGVTMDGEKISEDDESYEIKVEHGTVRVQKDKVLRIEQLTPE